MRLEESMQKEMEEERKEARANDAKHAEEKRMRVLMYGRPTKQILATCWKIPGKPIVRSGFYRLKVNTSKSPIVS